MKQLTTQTSNTTPHSSKSWLNMVNILTKDLNCNVNLPNQWVSQWTPLHYCCLNNNYEVAKLLIKHPYIHLEMKDTYGRSALSYACEYGIWNMEELNLFSIVT